MFKYDDQFFMTEALKEAKKAFSENEVPIGAVIVLNNRVIARAHNQIEMLKDATAHAEILAITQASNALGDWRLNETAIYVTKEPCPMCAGALINSRVKTLVFGLKDYEMGSAGSAINLLQNEKLRHQLIIKGGIKEQKCREILQEFFKIRRLRSKMLDN